MFFNSAGEELDSYYPVRPECQADVPKTRFKARVCKNVLIRFPNSMYPFLLKLEHLLFIDWLDCMHFKFIGGRWSRYLICLSSCLTNAKFIEDSQPALNSCLSNR